MGVSSKKTIVMLLLLLVFLTPLVFTFRATTYNVLKTAAIELFAAFTFVLWLVNIYSARQFRTVNWPLNLPVLTFLIWKMASTLWAVNKFEALEVIILQIALVALYFITLNNARDIESFVMVMIAAGGVVSIYGILQCLGIDFIIPESTPIVSTLGNVNFAGEYLVMIIPLSVAMAFHRVNAKRRIIIFATLAMVMFIYLLLTKSRGAWVGLMGGGIVLFFIGPVSKHRLKLLLYLALITIIALSVIYVISGGSEVFSIKDEAVSVFDARGYGVLFRLFVWQSTLRMIRENPINGVGAGNFKITYPLYRSSEEHDISGANIRVEKPHNDYLGITSEFGLIGLGLFLWILVTVFKVFRKLVESQPILATGLLVSVVSMLATAVFGFPFHTPATSLTFWVILGIAGASWADMLPASRRELASPPLRVGARLFHLRAGIVLAGALALAVLIPIYVARLVASDFHLQKVRAYQKRKLWDKTISECEKSIQSYYPNIQAHVFLARALQKKEKMQEAFVELQTILRLHPNHPWTHMSLGTIYLRLNRPDEAIAFLEKAGALNPVYFNHLGVAYLQKNMLEEALLTFEKALTTKAKREITYTHLVIFYETKGDLDKAILMYRKALEVAPDYERAQGRLEAIVD